MLYSLTELTGEEVKVIGAALGRLPYEVVHPLLAKLQTQLSAQEAGFKPVAPPELTDEPPAAA